jgi:hypothetical protein
MAASTAMYRLGGCSGSYANCKPSPAENQHTLVIRSENFARAARTATSLSLRADNLCNGDVTPTILLE